MAKRTTIEPKHEPSPVSDDDIHQLQTKLLPYQQKRIDGVLVSRFDQYMIDLGLIKFKDGEWFMIDPVGYKMYSLIEQKRKAWEAWQNEKEGTMPKFDLTPPPSLIKRMQ